MTREEIIKHWEVIEAFKNGKVVEFLNINDNTWMTAGNLVFTLEYEYRVKPVFTPKNGDRILVSNNDREYLERIFVRMEHDRYICMRTADNKIISDSLNTIGWDYAKPLEKEIPKDDNLDATFDFKEGDTVYVRNNTKDNWKVSAFVKTVKGTHPYQCITDGYTIEWRYIKKARW